MAITSAIEQKEPKWAITSALVAKHLPHIIDIDIDIKTKGK